MDGSCAKGTSKVRDREVRGTSAKEGRGVAIGGLILDLPGRFCQPFSAGVGSRAMALGVRTHYPGRFVEIYTRW
jgi:hypothetical protein